jgi:hypothetical protein
MNQFATIYTATGAYKSTNEITFSPTARVNNYQKQNGSAQDDNMFHVPCQYKRQKLSPIQFRHKQIPL